MLGKEKSTPKGRISQHRPCNSLVQNQYELRSKVKARDPPEKPPARL